MGYGTNTMANLSIEMPDDLARSLEGIAAARHKSVQQVAVEQLRSLVAHEAEQRPGSAAAVLRVLSQPSHPSDSDVAELEAAIAGGRLPAKPIDIFPG